MNQCKKDPHMRKQIYLTGFMGTGKSAVARALQKRYGFCVAEMDELLEAEQGRSISDIFEKEGEVYFRNLETSLLQRIAQKDSMVVSCGGGIVLRKENTELMKDSGTVVLLEAKPECILSRVKRNEKRPVLKGKKTVEEIETLMEERKEAYHRAADVIVQTDEKTPEEIADEIYRAVLDGKEQKSRKEHKDV